MADIKQAVETASGLLSCFCNILVGFELVYLFVCEPNFMFVTMRSSLGGFSGMLRVLHSGLSLEMLVPCTVLALAMKRQPPMCMPSQITWKRTGSNAFHAQDTTKHFT